MPSMPLSTPQEVRNKALRNSLRLVEINIKDCRNKSSVMQRFSEILVLPDTFGRNWDALIDVLRDLQATDTKQGLILMIFGAESLHRDAPEDYEILSSILEEWSAGYAPNKLNTYLFDPCD